MKDKTNGMALFAGAGGLELGLHLALGDAYRTVVYVEREAYAAATLVGRMEDQALDPAPVWDDVSTFDGRPWRGVVDLISGGFPCQDISSAGRQEGIVQGNRSGLWFQYARIIGEVGPRLVFVENVSALAIRGLDIVLGTLADLGFDAEWMPLAAGDVGAPHKRERIFILANNYRWRRGERADEAQSEPTGGGAARIAPGGNGSVAHTEGHRGQRRTGDVREANGRSKRGMLPQPELSGAELAHAADDLGRRGERGAEEGAGPGRLGRRGSPGSGQELADADLGGLQGAGVSGSRWSEVPHAGGTGENLSDSEREGRQGLRPGEPARGSEPFTFRGDWPAFPPGPGDTEIWREIIERDPSVEPAIRGMADGLAARVDRLRLCGNGVVPIVAAVAYRALAHRFGIEE